MNLEHIAISIISPNEITDFYHNILGMQQVRNFILNKNLAFDIFGFNSDVPVYILNKENLYLEIFITKENICKGFNHICLSVKNRTKLVKNARDKAYKCILIKRNPIDLVFIKDKSGNVFEIKNR